MSHNNSQSSHHHVRPVEPVLTPPSKSVAHVESVAERAYEKFVSRGRQDGFDREDWIAAEQELAAEKS
jgi:hypothetical protein